MNSACHSPIGKSMGRCCRMKPPDELEKARDGAATPVLLPHREKFRAGCFKHYAWTYFYPARNGFFFPRGAEERLRSPSAGREGGSGTEASGEQGRARLSPQPQSCCSVCVWYTYASDFTVMHFYHQHCPKPFRRAQH